MRVLIADTTGERVTKQTLSVVICFGFTYIVDTILLKFGIDMHSPLILCLILLFISIIVLAATEWKEVDADFYVDNGNLIYILGKRAPAKIELLYPKIKYSVSRKLVRVFSDSDDSEELEIIFKTKKDMNRFLNYVYENSFEPNVKRIKP